MAAARKPYRIAVFSDLHGNPFALDALLESLHGNGPFDRVIAAGDLAFGGSDPAYCIDRIREARIEAVYGNTEVYIYAPEKTPGDRLHLKKWDRILEDVHWHRHVLGQNRVAWLRGLPFSLTFNPSADPKEGLHIFHANPRDIETMLLPPAEDQVRIEGQLLQPDNDPVLIAALSGVGPNTLVFGHYHFSSLRKWGEKRLINIAPASCPAKDQDPRTRYTVFEWDGRWTFRRILLAYDYGKEIAALPGCGLPNWQDSANTFPA
jgi:predicted phosphodiesterase